MTLFAARRGAKWVGHEDRVWQGLIDHKFRKIDMPDGSERQEPQVYLTPKGITRLATIFRLSGVSHG